MGQDHDRSRSRFESPITGLPSGAIRRHASIERGELMPLEPTEYDSRYQLNRGRRVALAYVGYLAPVAALYLFILGNVVHSEPCASRYL